MKAESEPQNMVGGRRRRRRRRKRMRSEPQYGRGREGEE